ncbi:MAG TPA: hypothetical protein VMT87_11990 [Vicinamibacteria bacterium]|nr:hypothetical protein [Vicinamibacteria bacterium]
MPVTDAHIHVQPWWDMKPVVRSMGENARAFSELDIPEPARRKMLEENAMRVFPP